MTTRQSFLAVAWCSDKAGHRHLWPLMAFSSWLIQGWQRWWPEVTTLRLHLFEKNQWKLPSQPRLRCTIPRQACNSCQFAELLQYASPESFPVRDVSANLFFPSDLTPSALCRHGLLAYHASEPGRECSRTNRTYQLTRMFQETRWQTQSTLKQDFFEQNMQQRTLTRASRALAKCHP